MITSKMNMLSMCMLSLIAISIYCCEKTETEGNKVGDKKPTIDKADEENYDDLGERFLSLLSEKLKMKIIKNKAANEGFLDPTQFRKENLTKDELEEVHAALVQAMQPLFGKFVSELAETDTDNSDRLEIDGLADANKKDNKEEAEGGAIEELVKKTEKKSSTSKKEKDEDPKEKKDEKVKGKTGKINKPNNKKEKIEGAVKNHIKDEMKPERSKEKNDTKLKEELVTTNSKK